MSQLHFDTKAADKWLKQSDRNWQEAVQAAHDTLHQGTGRGNDFLGWLNPLAIDSEEVARIVAVAEQIRANSDVLLVIGIGGSYAGARAGIEMLTHTFRNQIGKGSSNGPEIYYIGHNLSAAYMTHLFELIKDRDVSVNVISKSGTTTEPAIAFRLVREFLINKYGLEEAGRRIVATTDGAKGALRQLATEEGYQTFSIADDIGGRFSVLTAVGLLPMAVAGINVQELLAGAHEAEEIYANPNLDENICYQYVASRNNLYRQGKAIELLVSYDPRFVTFAEWWKQLFGESEGKEGKGLYPASVQFTTDLHSMGQYIQEGPRHLFETVLWVENSGSELLVPGMEADLDGLNYLQGKSLDYVNKQAFLGTLQAHQDGEVPNFVLQISELNERTVGHLFYFFMKACGLSGYVLGVNPFDQPGVEAYKRNMFQLLGKPGV